MQGMRGRGVVAVAGVCAAAVVVAVAAAAPRPLAPSEELIYVATGGAVRALSADGSAAFDVTDAGQERSFTADGTRSVAVEGYSLLVALGDGNDPTTVHPSDESIPSEPALSPDATQIAYNGVASGDPQALHHIYVMRADGSGARALTAGPVDTEPSWSPDGQEILFTRSFPTGGPPQLLTVDLAGNVRHVGAPLAFDGSWSPDGSRVAYVEPGNRKLHIATSRVDGSDGHSVTQETQWLPPYEVSRPVWSPDGTRIAFVGDGQTLFIVNADGSGLHAIFSSPGRLGLLAWRNVSRSLAVTADAQQLPDVLPNRQPVAATFKLRSIGGAEVRDIAVWLHVADATVLPTSVGSCRLTPTSPCTGVTIQHDGYLEVVVHARTLRPGRLRIAVSATSQDESGSTRDDVAAVSSVVSPCTVLGTDGPDRLRASRNGGDLICGGGGADTINARNGKRDTVDGGPGLDTAFVDNFDMIRRVERIRRG